MERRYVSFLQGNCVPPAGELTLLAAVFLISLISFVGVSATRNAFVIEF